MARLSNDQWYRLMGRIEDDHLTGGPVLPDYSGTPEVLPEVSCDVCGRVTTSRTHLCPRCRDVMEDEDRRFGAVFGGPTLGEPDDE